MSRFFKWRRFQIVFICILSLGGASQGWPQSKLRPHPDQRFQNLSEARLVGTQLGLKQNRQRASRHNLLLGNQQPYFQLQSRAVRPFADIEPTGYVFMSEEYRFDSLEAKKSIIRSLPADVTVVLYTNERGESALRRIRSEHQGLRDPSKLIVVTFDEAEKGFWARDALPIPVIESATGEMSLVDAKYTHDFEADDLVAAMFGAPLQRHNFFFEGGNFMANSRGDCILVQNTRHAQIPNTIFERMYGCSRLLRLPHLFGIGHIDEHVRFLDDMTVVTDLAGDYQDQLESFGYKVLQLPRPSHPMYTYVNALIANGLAMVPIYGERTDQAALKVFEDFGYRVIGVRTNRLSRDGLGSLHCITMNYPKVSMNKLVQMLKLKVLSD